MAVNLDTLRALGFNKSTRKPFTRRYNVGCSGCAATVINGIPTHESGCRNAKHECRGCWELIPRNRQYCEECQ